MPDNPLLRGNIIFNAKPDAVPYNYRVSYKVSQLCLIMRICGWGDSCSLVKLQMISFALFSRNNMENLIRLTEEEVSSPSIVRFDPAVNKALTFSIAYGFVIQQKNGTYKLTEHGHIFAEKIIIVGDLMVTEIYDLRRLSKKLTENKIKEITDMWRAKNAED